MAHWSDDFVGIPYADRGRTRAGADCWGLVRLVHEEVFGNRLPSFVDQYETASDRERLDDLIARHREGWARADLEQPGDVALFRILGHPSHVGVITHPGYMLHVREGQAAVVERITAPQWAGRLEGIYRYRPGAGVSVAACAHPLRTERIDTQLPHGMTVRQMVEALRIRAGAPEAVNFRAHVMIDGRACPEDCWDYVPDEGARVEIRCVAAGSGILRQILMLAVVIAAAFLAPILAGAIGVTGAFATNLVQLGLTTAGALLVNFIFPVREPKPEREGRGQQLLVGGRNNAEPYGAIPVILGRVRFTPPLAANYYVETNEKNSYLRQPLCWGYGPLQISDLRIGATKLDDYEEVDYETLLGEVGETKTQFNKLYGRDVSQLNVGVKLECNEIEVTSASRTSNVVTVVCAEPHGFQTGWEVSLSADASFEPTNNIDPPIPTSLAKGTITSIDSATQFKFSSTGSNGSIAANWVVGSPWTTRTMGDESDRITVTLHFPEGLRWTPSKGESAGKTRPQKFRAVIQVRQLDSNTLAPLTAWGDINKTTPAQTFTIGQSWYNIDDDAALEPVYRWTRVSIDDRNKLVIRQGAFTSAANSGPSGNLLTRLQQDNFGQNVSFERLPAIGPGEEHLWDIQTFGATIHATIDQRSGNISGGALAPVQTATGWKYTLSAVTITRAQTDVVVLGGAGERYYKMKDAFTVNYTFDVAQGLYEVRARRTNAGDADFGPDDGRRRLSDCYLQTITGYEQRRPITPPAPLAMTAMRVKATNQLNQTIEGITGTVQSVCLDWNGTTWVTRPTRNPASLFRYVLQHPANAQAVTNSKIDLAALADWHDYCRASKFRFDAAITEQRPLWDVLADIAAAGRASPTLVDGKWSVIIDRPRTTIAQHFTPHNSWGFEGTRALAKMPHGFRVQFFNAQKGYQPDERIVYRDGYSASNATLLEGLTLPGVTDPDTVFKHARFHIAQLQLRPERYTLNVDIEHLVATRGDLVRITHDVPMWGLGSGRIKTRVSGTVLELDEAVPMAASTQYTIRIRLEDGSSITRTVASVGTAGLYSTITLTSSVDTTQGKPGNLFMFGALNSESVEAIVLSIEPAENMTARLTLHDYAPAVYDSDSETLPPWDSQITLPPDVFQPAINAAPTIIEMRSDEGILERLPTGGWRYGLRVTWRNPQTLPDQVNGVVAEIAFANTVPTAQDWERTTALPIDAKSVTFWDVEEGDTYRVRLKYTDSAGRVGPWTVSDEHVIVGRTTPPSNVTGFTAETDGTRIVLSWDANPEIDIAEYEIRTTNSGWGTAGFVYRGKATLVRVNPPASGNSVTYYIRARDAARLFSPTAVSATYTTSTVPNVASISETFQDTSLTSATITLDWPDVAPAFGLKGYKVSYASVTKFVAASTITLPADWIGSRTFTVKTVDLRGNESSGTSKSISKLAPNQPTNVRAQVIDNNVLLFWTLPAKTTLPVNHVRIKEGASWAGGTDIGIKSGTFTSLSVLTAGTRTYWLASVDTDGNESTPVSVSATMSEPPDFVFNGEFNSTFTGTKTNAYTDGSYLILPVNTTETWAQHFTNNGWTTIQNQIDAGRPIYAQPAVTSGSYVETFDFGTVLGSSRVTVNALGSVVSGSPTVVTTIETSPDNSTWTAFAGTTQAYATNFRYIRVTITVTSNGATGLYRVDALNVLLDAKLKNDAGIVSAASGDANGTVANFTKEFLDIQSITATPQGTASASVVYDFGDNIINGTYSVTSNVCTVTATAHGLVAGQRVRLAFTSGTAPPGVYTVASVTSANVYTVSLTTANTSGNVSTYPQGFRVYLFNSAGTRISGTVSWSVKGY